MIGRDGWAGLVILASSLVPLWLTLGLKDNPLVPVGPGFYPRIVLGVTALFAVLVVIGDALARRAAGWRGRPRRRWRSRANYPLVLASFAVFGAYCVALPGLGFRIATFLYVVAAAALLAPPRGAKRWVAIAACSRSSPRSSPTSCSSATCSVLLPRGRWTGF